MKPLSLVFAAALISACGPVADGRAATPAATDNSENAAAIVQDSGVEAVCFEPEGDCIGLMVRHIQQARSEIRVMTFLFSNRRVINALNAAQDRGVRVRMIVASSREGASRVVAVQRRGAEVLTRDDFRQHSKYLIIDRRVVITGSQNFTVASENNSENTLVIDDPRTVAAYVRNWDLRASGSRPSSLTAPERPDDAES